MVTETHRRLVASLYRQSLRLSKNWINRRDIWRTKAVEIRHQFDNNKSVTDPRKIHYLLSNTQALLAKYAHPDPIIPPQRPGGTKFERNVFPPQEERKYNALNFFINPSFHSNVSIHCCYFSTQGGSLENS